MTELCTCGHADSLHNDSDRCLAGDCDCRTYDSIEGGYEVNEAQHKARHEKLHRALDELAADYIVHTKTGRLSNTTVLQLMEWSFSQCQHPTTDEKETQ